MRGSKMDLYFVLALIHDLDPVLDSTSGHDLGVLLGATLGRNLVLTLVLDWDQALDSTWGLDFEFLSRAKLKIWSEVNWVKLLVKRWDTM